MEFNLNIRPARKEDAKKLLAIYAPYVEKTAITFEYEVPSEQEFIQRMENTLRRYPYLVAEKEGKIVGYAYASQFHVRPAYDWVAEVSIYVEQRMKKCGIGKALYQMLEKILFAQNITNLTACIACPEEEDEFLNRNSIQFHEHMGYSMVGKFHQCGYKFHRWYHMVWMEKMIADHREHQAKIIPFPEICASFFAS